MESLLERLKDALVSGGCAAEADEMLSRTHALGLVSDWVRPGIDKAHEFARLLVAVRSTFPPGGTVETGVLTGGTSGLLILSCEPESFHVSIDPYGLPSQSYDHRPDFGDWHKARITSRRLHTLADEQNVTYCHYYMASQAFCRCDLLQHPGRFNIVHLDGDHAYGAVRAELDYFMAKIPAPTIYVMDDHDSKNPGVERALRDVESRLVQLFHRLYDFPRYGEAGFSAWLHAEQDPDRAA